MIDNNNWNSILWFLDEISTYSAYRRDCVDQLNENVTRNRVRTRKLVIEHETKVNQLEADFILLLYKNDISYNDLREELKNRKIFDKYLDVMIDLHCILCEGFSDKDITDYFVSAPSQITK